jgi:hypothetical protein
MARTFTNPWVNLAGKAVGKNPNLPVAGTKEQITTTVLTVADIASAKAASVIARSLPKNMIFKPTLLEKVAAAPGRAVNRVGKTLRGIGENLEIVQPKVLVPKATPTPAPTPAPRPRPSTKSKSGKGKGKGSKPTSSSRTQPAPAPAPAPKPKPSTKPKTAKGKGGGSKPTKLPRAKLTPEKIDKIIDDGVQKASEDFAGAQQDAGRQIDWSTGEMKPRPAGPTPEEIAQMSPAQKARSFKDLQSQTGRQDIPRGRNMLNRLAQSKDPEVQRFANDIRNNPQAARDFVQNYKGASYETYVSRIKAMTKSGQTPPQTAKPVDVSTAQSGVGASGKGTARVITEKGKELKKTMRNKKSK